MNMILACIDSIYDADNVYDAKDETQESLKNFIESLSSVQFLKLSQFLENMPALSYDADLLVSEGRVFLSAFWNQYDDAELRWKDEYGKIKLIDGTETATSISPCRK